MGTGHKNPEVDERSVSAEDVFAGIDQIKTGIAIYDKDLKLLFANKQIRKYLPNLYASLDTGMSLIDAIKVQIKIIRPEKAPSEIEEQAANIHNTIINSGNLELSTPDGLTLKSSYDKTSRGIYILTTTDITDHIEYENNLAIARRKADMANESKSEFLANMSHEIRTPLSGISMAAQILQQQLDGTENAAMSELANILVDSAKHLSSTLNDILDLSKIEAGQIDIVMQESSLADMLDDVIKSQRNIALKQGVELILVIDKNLPQRLLHDPVRVRQCVSNLISNALKFTASGSVTVAAMFDVETYNVTLHVADTGTGIAPDEQVQVFDHFVQAKQDLSAGHTGSGLGLAISRKLARLMHGDITLKSEVGKGSIFTLTFKIEPAEAVTDNLVKAA